MNVKDDIVDESVPVAGRHHGDEADQILELSSTASEHQPSPTSEDSSTFKSTKKKFKTTGDSTQDDFEQEPQEEEQKEDEDPARRSSAKSDSTAATSAQAKRPPKKKGGNWKKPPGMPKRPLSAYNLFFRQMRLHLLGDEVSREFQITDQSKRRHRPSHGKIGFKELATLVGSKWKNTQGAERKVYEDQASLEMQRYKKEVEEWKKAGGSSNPPPSTSPHHANHPLSSSAASLPSHSSATPGGGTAGTEKDDSPSSMMTVDSSMERQQQQHQQQQEHYVDVVGSESPSKKEAADALAGLSDEVSAATGPPAMRRSVTHPPMGSVAAAASFHPRSTSLPIDFGSPSTLTSPVAAGRMLHDTSLLMEQGRPAGFPRQPLGEESPLYGGGGGGGGLEPGRRSRMQQLYELHLAEARFLREELERNPIDAMQEQRVGLGAAAAIGGVGVGGGGLSSSMRSVGSTDPLSVSTRTASSAAAAAASQDPFWPSMIGGGHSGLSSSLGSGHERIFQSPTSQQRHQQQHLLHSQHQVGLGSHGAMGFNQQQQMQMQMHQQQHSQEQQYRAQQQQQQLLLLQQSQQQQQQRLQELSLMRQQQLGNLSQQQQQHQQQQHQQGLSLPLYGTNTITSGGGSVGGGMDMSGRSQRMQMLEDALQAERARQVEDEIRMFLHRRQSGGGGGGGGAPGGGM